MRHKTALISGSLTVVILQLAFYAAVLYTVVHFVRKFW